MMSDMTHPTDDELEAMAVKLDCYSHDWQLRHMDVNPLTDTAAMLRACKGWVKRLPRTDGEGGWTLPVELLAEIRDEVYANEWDAPCAEVIEIIALSVEARILAALEPAPGYLEGWNDAREADGRPCSTDRFLAALFDETDDHFDRAEAIKHWLEGGWNDAMEGFSETAIRALTPPERPDQ